MTSRTDHSRRAPEQPPVTARIIPLHLNVELFASGLGAGITRAPRCDLEHVPLITPPRFQPAWLPHWPQLQTIGLEFPEASFLDVGHNDCIAPAHDTPCQPQSTTPTPSSQTPQRKPTRLSISDTALSISDRLYCLLQPPLESLLSGQELVMPFEPFPFQYEGIAWLFSHSAALLADEMGLGKTMQAISAIRLLLRAGHIRSVLLVCPKPLITNWQRELAMWAEELPVLPIEGPASRRQMLWQVPQAPIKIANYELLVRDFEMIGEDDFPAFDLVVLDEAQRIKNRGSRTSQTARALKSQRSWALTGTPMENRPDEFVTLLEFLRATPDKSALDIGQLNRLAREYVLRRTKDRVLKDLPPRLDRDEYLQLNPAQEAAYRTAERDGVVQLNELGESITIQHVFELVLRLKQIANFDPLTGQSCKLDRLSAEMEEIASSGGKAILFSQWTKCLDWLARQLEHLQPLVFHGGVASAQRDATLHRFEHDPDAHLILMSYGVGAVGLNLQFAGYVFLFDRWWNPAVEDQAINRAHRIGQQNPVLVTKFICRDTIEERIDRVLKQKRDLFNLVLGDSDISNVSLSLDAREIFGLFDLKTGHGADARSISPQEPVDN
ncbi:MAG: DEAD/DEAH box helicase [Planctomycetaceae bacterium]|nr:DEAD/DEAH box helicase [Planctomycetaceae bacterium]